MKHYFRHILTSEDDQDTGFINLVRVVLILSTMALTIIAIVLALTPKDNSLWRSVGVISTMAILSGISLFLSYRNILWPGKALLPLIILGGVTFLAINANGLRDSAVAGFTFVIVITALITGQKAIPLATFLTLLGVWTVAYAEMTGITNSALAQKSTIADIVVISLVQIVTAVSLNGLKSRLNSAAQAARINAQAQIEANQELRELQAGLEQRVAERTQALTTVAEVGTAASTILETDNLLQQVVDLAKERFNFYHAHIYLLNEAADTLVLSSGAGEVGRLMVAEGHSIPLDREQSLVARAARERKGVTVNDVTTAPDFLPNPLLPNTRSELAVPMVIGEQVIGVFDVQSEVAGRFTDTDIAAQTTLASQIAAAVQNARSYTKVREAEQLTRTIIDATLDAIYIKDRKHRYLMVNEGYANPLHVHANELIGKDDLELGFPEELVKGNAEKGIRGYWTEDDLVFETGKTQHFSNDQVIIDGVIHILDTIKIPLRNAEGEIWAVLAFSRDVTESERLHELTAQRAHQQETINLVTQKIQSAITVEEALQVAAREVGHVLGGRETIVALEPPVLADDMGEKVVNEKSRSTL
jgi:GAF domain-containing protein